MSLIRIISLDYEDLYKTVSRVVLLSAEGAVLQHIVVGRWICGPYVGNVRTIRELSYVWGIKHAQPAF